MLYIIYHTLYIIYHTLYIIYHTLYIIYTKAEKHLLVCQCQNSSQQRLAVQLSPQPLVGVEYKLSCSHYGAYYDI